jgi:hypothetical protein
MTAEPEVIRPKFDLKEALDAIRSFGTELVRYSQEPDLQKKVEILKNLGIKVKSLGNTILMTTADDIKPPETEKKGFSFGYKKPEEKEEIE